MRDGERVLSAAEWNLVAAGLDVLWDTVEAGGTDQPSGLSAFDTLTSEQQIALLADVAAALREPHVPAPPLTAATEAAVAAVFETLRALLELERLPGEDNRHTPEIRRLVRAASGTHRGTCMERVTAVEERILWDRDFELGSAVLDLPPEHASVVLRGLAIDPEYFLAVPRDPDAEGLTGAQRTLARLLGRTAPSGG